MGWKSTLDTIGCPSSVKDAPPPVPMFQILAVLSQLRWVEESLVGGEGGWVYGVERNVTHAVCVPFQRLDALSSLNVPDLTVLSSLPVARRVGFLGWKATHFHTACVPTKRQDAVSMPVSMFHILAVPSPDSGGKKGWICWVESYDVYVVFAGSVRMHLPVATFRILAVLLPLPVARGVGSVGWKETYSITT